MVSFDIQLSYIVGFIYIYISILVYIFIVIMILYLAFEVSVSYDNGCVHEWGHKKLLIMLGVNTGTWQR